MRILKKIYTILLILVVYGSVQAQEKEVFGVVRDANGTEVLGVAVTIKGTHQGTQTDINGRYTIQVNQGETLEFSFLGLKTKTVKVGASSRIDVILEDEVQRLEELVVVGYGSGRKVGNVVGSVAHVSGRQIAQRPASTLTDALQGKVAGVAVASTTGNPAATPTVVIHGVGSLGGTSSQPLYVIDGIIVDDEALLSLNSADIESVSVLKDASATSIYGSRAANGVIYITTKQGNYSASGKGEITFNSQYGSSYLADRSFFEKMMTSEELLRFWVEREERTQEEVDELRARYPYNTRWDKVFFRDNIPLREFDLSVSGGNDRTRYYLSGGYYDQEGLMYNSAFKRYTLRSNIETKVNDWLKIGINATGAYYTVNTPNGDTTSYNTDGTAGYFVAPFYSPVDENGKEYELIPGLGKYHPHYYARKHPSGMEGFELIPTGFVQINPLKGLLFKSQAGMQYDNSLSQSTTLPSYPENLRNGNTSKTYSKGLVRTLTNTLEYQFKLAPLHNFVTLLGQETNINEFVSVSAQGEGLTDDDLALLSNTTDNKEVSEGVTKSTLNSFFGRIEYDYTGKYFVDFSLRRDGSSKFSPNHKYANFWAAGLLWKLKKEDFLINNKTISDLDLRFSVGTSGNSSIGNYPHQALLHSGQYNGKTGFTLASSGNPDLTWEEQKKYTLGVSSQFWERLSLDIELYRRISYKMLLDVPLPSTTGFTSVMQNVGDFQNQGIDFTLRVDAYQNSEENINITPYINFGYNQDKVLALFQDRDSWTSVLGLVPVIYKVGEGIHYWLPIYKGVNPDNGEPQWYEPGADPTVETKDENHLTSTYSQELSQNYGKNIRPKINGGFGLSANYKALSLEADFSFSALKYLYNYTKMVLHNPTTTSGFNQHRDNFDYWKQPGDKARFPKVGYNYTEDDSDLVEDASYIRLKNITLAYTLPQEVIQQVGFFSNVKLYLTGRNLLTWTKYSGIDPEVNLYTSALFPNTKQYVFGVELKF